MIDSRCDSICIWTETGPDRSAVDLCFTEIPDGFHIDVSAPTAALTRIVLRWRRRMAENVRILGDHWERGYGDLEWRALVPERTLPWYILALNSSNGTVQGLGVATGAASFAAWHIDEQGITLTLDVRCGAKGVRLGGRVLRVATVHTRNSHGRESLFEFGRRFCKVLCRNPRLPEFPVYGGNDWYYAYGQNSENIIRRDAALIRELSTNRENAPFMVIDAGWSPAGGCRGGPYEHGNAHFPDMQLLASALESQGVRPGIWIRPLQTAAAPVSWRMPAEHPIWRREQNVILDPSVPEVLAHIRADITRMREWGFRLIKHDFTTFDLTGRWGFEMNGAVIEPGAWSFADRTKTTAEIVSNLYRTIRDAAQDAILIGCNTVGHLGAGIFEIQRTGDDTSGREWERTRKMGVNTLAFRMIQHETFFAADADCVGLTNAVPWSMNRQWMELLSASGTPFFVSADPAAIGPAQRVALRCAFERASSAQPPAEPVDWLQTTCPRRWRFGRELQSFDWIPPDGIS